MFKITKFFAISLLIIWLSACDNKNDKNVSRPISLLEGKMSFILPADMSYQSGKLGKEANNMHVYADKSGEKAVIVILSDDTNETLDVLAQRLADQQRTRDTNLQIVTNKAIQVNGQSLQQLDSIITSGGDKAYSSVIIGKIDNHLVTLQITLPAINQQQAQLDAESIINTLTFK